MIEDDVGAAVAHAQPPTPHPALRSLDGMVGTWEVNGREFGTDAEIQGTVALEWMEGGFFVIQRVDTNDAGRRISGTEYIGYEAENANLRSYFFSNEGPGPFGGVALEYVWEVGEDTLTIWGGFVGSPGNFKGTFSDDRNTITGRWEWPGGGYEATMTRVG